MSYSVCHQCNKMVSAYQKYCPECIEKFPAIQCENYWKLSSEEREAVDKEEARIYHEQN